MMRETWWSSSSSSWNATAIKLLRLLMGVKPWKRPTPSCRITETESTKRIPVIILTAKGQMRDVFEMASNVAFYMEKPFDPKHLREKIQEVLSKAANK